MSLQRSQHAKYCFEPFNPLKSTQRGSNADGTDDFPPKPLYPTKTYFTKEYHIFWEGVGGWGLQQWSTSRLNNHHQKKNLPRNVVTHFTLQLRHTKPTLLRRCGSVFTVTTSQTGQQVGAREEETGYLAIHSTTLTQRTVETQHQHAVRGEVSYTY